MESTRSIHYPAHLASMAMLRPHLPAVDLETWFEKNFEPGIVSFLEEDLGLTPEELAVEHRVWREFTNRHTPPFFPGFLEALAAYRQRGGHIAVASHSESQHILAHYRGAANGTGVVPDLVFGWDLEPRLRKPHPHAVHEVMRYFGLPPGEMLVVDDLKPGVAMARAAGVDAAAAGWGHDIPVIRHWMSRHCVAYLSTVEDFAQFILQ